MVLLGLPPSVLVNLLFLFGFLGDNTTALPFGSTTTRSTADLIDLDGSGGGGSRTLGDSVGSEAGATSICLLALSIGMVEPSKFFITRRNGSLAGIRIGAANIIGFSPLGAMNGVKASMHLI